jgi:hypothetical protein
VSRSSFFRSSFKTNSTFKGTLVLGYITDARQKHKLRKNVSFNTKITEHGTTMTTVEMSTFAAMRTKQPCESETCVRDSVSSPLDHSTPCAADEVSSLTSTPTTVVSSSDDEGSEQDIESHCVVSTEDRMHPSSPNNSTIETRHAEWEQDDIEATKKTECVLEESIAGRKIPNSVRYMTCAFYFVYMGVVSGYASWCPTYALQSSATSSYQGAANVIAIFFGAVTFGRLLAVFLAVKFSATVILRGQLLFLTLASVALVCIAEDGFVELCVATALLGKIM